MPKILEMASYRIIFHIILSYMIVLRYESETCKLFSQKLCFHSFILFFRFFDFQLFFGGVGMQKSLKCWKLRWSCWSSGTRLCVYRIGGHVNCTVLFLILSQFDFVRVELLACVLLQTKTKLSLVDYLPLSLKIPGGSILWI